MQLEQIILHQRKPRNQPQVLRECVMLIGSKTELVTIGEDTYSDSISLTKHARHLVFDFVCDTTLLLTL